MALSLSSVTVLIDKAVMNMVDHKQNLISVLQNRWMYGWKLTYNSGEEKYVENEQYNGFASSSSEKLLQVQHLYNLTGLTWDTLGTSDLESLRNSTEIRITSTNQDVNTTGTLDFSNEFVTFVVQYYVDGIGSVDLSSNADTIQIHIYVNSLITTIDNPEYTTILNQWKQDGIPTYSNQSDNFRGQSFNHTVNARHTATRTSFAQTALIENDMLASRVVSNLAKVGSVDACHLNVRKTITLGDTTLDSDGFNGLTIETETVEAENVTVKGKLDFEELFFEMATIGSERRLLLKALISDTEYTIAEWSIDPS